MLPQPLKDLFVKYWRHLLIAVGFLSAGLIHFFGFYLYLPSNYRLFLDSKFRYDFSSNFVFLFFILSFIARYAFSIIIGFAVSIYQQRIEYIYGSRGYKRYPTTWAIEAKGTSDSIVQIKELWNRKKDFDVPHARIANFIKRKAWSQPSFRWALRNELLIPPAAALFLSSFLYVGAFRTLILILCLFVIYSTLVFYENVRNKLLFDIGFVKRWNEGRKTSESSFELDTDNISRIISVFLLGAFIMGALRLDAMKVDTAVELVVGSTEIKAAIIAPLEAGILYYSQETDEFGIASPEIIYSDRL